MKFARFLIMLAAAGAIQAQTGWDTSGNGMLTGTYYFRQVYYVIGDQSGDLSEAVATYGNINFDGNGNYTITTTPTNFATYVDTTCQCVGKFAATTGTYSIAKSGYGFISSPYVTGDTIYGLVSAQGIFVGSSTDNAYGYNDIMVAAPQATSSSGFVGSWTAADFDLSSGSPQTALSIAFNFSPDASGNLNVGTISGYAGVTATPYTQSSSGLKYIISNNAAVATFPNNGTLIAGQKYLYYSKDGNFVFGGAPNSFDMIVGVKNTSTPTLSGLYYQVGLDEFEGDLDSYYGSFYVGAGAAPPCPAPLVSGCQTILGHERLNDFGGGSVYDYTYDDHISLSGAIFTNTYARYIVGAGGAVEITSGIGPYLGLSVGLQQPTVTPTGSVFLDPTRIQNAASNAPFTAGIAPGELLTLYGSNLAPTGLQIASSLPLPTSLGNVQVSIGGYPAAIYYVSPGQIAAIVPYEVSIGGIAQIQVTNAGVPSNIATNYVSATAPGVLTQNEQGTGYGDIEHLQAGNSVAAIYSLVSDANPAVEGETLSVYLTGLGTVTPSITDGAQGAGNTTTNTISVDINGTAGTNSFSGLPGCCAALYQLNVAVPTGLTTVGPSYLSIMGPDSVMSYSLIPVAATPPASDTANVRTPTPAVPPKFRRPPKGSPVIRRKF